MMMTIEQLKKIAIYASNANLEIYTPLLNQFMHEYNICGVKREAAFLATIIHESGSFVYTLELASGVAYEGRTDLGNVYPGDGVKFKGRGLIQLTGRENYTRASKAMGFDFRLNPEALEKPFYATKVSCWWWRKFGLNEIADTADFEAVTKRVNGGLNGYKDRLTWYKSALEVLSENY